MASDALVVVHIPEDSVDWDAYQPEPGSYCCAI
jgi:hypothetical protein